MYETNIGSSNHKSPYEDDQMPVEDHRIKNL